MHVRTRGDTPPVTTGYTVPNGFLKTYQISTQSAHPLPGYSKRVFFRHPICGARHVLQLSLTLLGTILIDRRGDGATHQRRPHANRTYGSRVISFSIMVLASVLMVFMASVNRALMSLFTSRWKPSITWQKTLFLMIASTNSTRAAAAKYLFRAKCRCLKRLKGSVLVAKKMNSGRACCSSGRVFSMLSQ